MNVLVRILFLISAMSINLVAQAETSSACLIASQILLGLEDNQETTIAAIVAGIEARDQGILLSYDDRRAYPLYIEQRRKQLAQKNLIDSEEWIANKCAEKETRVIIPSKLAYTIIKEGMGTPLTQENVKVRVNFTIKKWGDELPENLGRNRELNLKTVITGLAHGMRSMRVGEVRKLYIHPELAYQSHNFDPNMALEATVELLQILPNSFNGLVPEHSEEPKKTSSLLGPSTPNNQGDNLMDLKQRYLYVMGWKLWDFLRWGHTLFSKEELIQNLKNIQLTDVARQEDEINKVYWKIYHQKLKAEQQGCCVLENK